MGCGAGGGASAVSQTDRVLASCVSLYPVISAQELAPAQLCCWAGNAGGGASAGVWQWHCGGAGAV